MKRVLWASFVLALLLLAIPALVSGPEAPLPEPVPIDAVLQTALLPQTDAAAPEKAIRRTPAVEGMTRLTSDDTPAPARPSGDGNGVVLKGNYVFSAYTSFRLSERAG